MSNKSRSEAYAAAGVNIEAGYEGVKLMKKQKVETSTLKMLKISKMSLLVNY